MNQNHPTLVVPVDHGQRAPSRVSTAPIRRAAGLDADLGAPALVRPVSRRFVLGKAAVAALAAAAVGVGMSRNAGAQRTGERARAMQETALRDGASWVDRVLVTIPAGGVVLLGEER